MKKILKKLDIIYLIGILISAIGLYFNNRTFLMADTLYTISKLFTPLITNLFIYGGLGIIILEYLLTSDLPWMWQNYRLDASVRWRYFGVFLAIVITIGLFVMDPFNSYIITSYFLVGFVLLFLGIAVHWQYLIFAVLPVLQGIDNILYLRNDYIDAIGTLIIGIFIIIMIVLLVRSILNWRKRGNPYPFYRLVFMLVMVVGLLYVQSKIYEKEKQTGMYNVMYLGQYDYDSFYCEIYLEEDDSNGVLPNLVIQYDNQFCLRGYLITIDFSEHSWIWIILYSSLLIAIAIVPNKYLLDTQNEEKVQEEEPWSQ